MQAIGQKALGRIHLYASMFLTQHYYSMISYNYKHLVLSSWHSNHLYFIMYIYLITMCFTLCRSQ